MPNHTLITGASSGIGTAFAHLAAARGRNLILSARSQDRLEALADELRREHGRDVVVIPADLTSLDEVDRLWTEATRDGRVVDMLVNNAGLGSNGAFSEADGWERELTSIQVNLMAPTRLMKLALPAMRSQEGGGRVLNVASMAGLVPGPNLAVYHATKAYLVNLGRSLSQELKGTEVSVTTLCPGPVETNFFADAKMEATPIATMMKPAPARRIAEAGWAAAMERRAMMVPGALNKGTASAARILPGSLLAPVIHWMMSPRRK